MPTVWLRLRADVRLRWRALAALALLLGLVGGVVLTAAAGARRTDTAYPRLLTWANAAQVTISPNSDGPTPGYYAAVARLPQVAGEHQRRRGWAGRKSIRQSEPSQRRTRPIAGLARRVAAASASCASRTAVEFPGLRVVMVIAWPFQPSSW